MINIEIDDQLFQSHTLSFEIRADDPKAAFLIEDAPLEMEGNQYFITQVIDTHDDDGAMKEIVAEAGWMRLADLRRPGSFPLDQVTTRAGLDAILDGTGWTTGEAPTSATLYSLASTDSTVLSLIWQWAKITGYEVSFDTMQRRVSFVDQVGVNRGLSFRYGVNLESIKRTANAPKVTRLYAYGKNDLDLSSLYSGQPYIEDYSYYTDLGYTLAEAQANYRKDEVVYDDSFTDVNALDAWAQARLAILAQPTVLYEASVADLSYVITGLNTSLKFRCGDNVQVFDEVLGWDLQARVTRTVKHPTDPAKDKVELAFSPVLIPDARLSSTRPDTGSQWELFESRNWLTPRYVRNGSTILHRVVLKTVEGAEWVVGFKLQGIAEGASTITIEATDDSTGDPFWATHTQACVDGDEVNFNFTYGQKDIPAGEYTLVIRAYSDTALAGFDIAQLDTAFWVLARGTTRDGITLPNSERFDYNGETAGKSGGSAQQFTVPDDVSEIQIECHGAAGGPRSGASAGLGGKVVAKFPVVAGTVYDVYVGGSPNSQAGGGWPNGGATTVSGAASSTNAGYGGGGSSDVRPQGTSLASAIIVAGGGGGSSDMGASRPEADAKGGNAGFYNAIAGWGLTPIQTPGVAGGGGGASQWAGGAAGTTVGGSGYPGTFGQGGNAADVNNAFHFGGGAGGGGWYGGGGAGQTVIYGGGSYAGDGGGGSGYVHPSGYDLEIQDGENDTHGYVIISWETPDT